MTWREGQDIRLPIYNKSNILLYEVYLEHPSGNGFSQNTSVEIKYNIDVNKNLVVFASADGQEVDVKIQNPFYTGSSLTPVQRRIRRLEGQWHSEKDTGIVSETTYKELTQAYKEDGQFLLAAKLMVEAKKIHPRIFSYNDIGLAFSRANDSGEACHYYRKALEEMPTSATIMFNLSYQLRKDDPEKERLLQEALRNDPEHAPSLIEYAKLIKHKDEEKADEFQLNAFNVLNKQYESNSLPEWGKSWLRSSALATGHLDTVRKINEEESNAPNNLLDDRVIVKGDIIKL
jgi:tetratricopeptide (TPR) repeat protein